MRNDSRDSTIRLGKAAVAVQRGTETSRIEIHAASLSMVPGRRPVRLCLEGATGSVTIELSRVAFWRLTAEFHEQSAAAEDVSSQQRTRRRPS
jgi:hypothetical protein